MTPDPGPAVALPDELLALLRSPSSCYVATIMPDGSPQLTLTWVDTDGAHVLVNTVSTHQKAKNLRRDPRVAVTVSDPANPSRYWEVRGQASELTEDGAAEHIDVLSRRYTGGDYPWYGGRDQVRLLVRITPERVRSMG
jgi:PPOX class probable F420-dependent enzyme